MARITTSKKLVIGLLLLLMLLLMLFALACGYSAYQDVYSTGQGETLSISAENGVGANDNSTESCRPISYDLIITSSHGVINFRDDGGFDYEPHPTYVGKDSFRYEGRPSSGCHKDDSNVIIFVGVNAQVVPDFYSTKQDTALTVESVKANDYLLVDGPASLVPGSGPKNGTLTEPLSSSGKFTYTPNSGFVGSDTFKYQVTKSLAEFAPGGTSTTVTIFVELSSIPLAHDDTFTVVSGNSVSRSAPGVLANDPTDIAGSSTATKEADPSKGTVVLNSDGSFTYTANTGATGTDAFKYKRINSLATSSTSERDVATVTINLPAVPVIVANPDLYRAIAGLELNVAPSKGVLYNDADPAGGTLSASLVKSTSKGALGSITDGGFTYTPNLTATGTDTFEYKVTNGTSTSASTTVTLIIEPNPVPSAVEDLFDYNSYTTSGSSISVASSSSVLINDFDPYGRPLTATIASQAENGTVALNSDGSFTYTPNSGFVGTDKFSYKASNGSGESATTTVTVITYTTAPPVSVPGLNTVALV